MKRILLLGDSIRMSYQPLVVNALAGRAKVVGPAENCQFSAHTLQSIDRWIDELGRPQIVHWNNGLHDCGHNPNREPVQYSVKEYTTNLTAILEKLKATGATVVWATTTPVHPDRPFVETQWSWRNKEIDKYSKAALDLMKSESIRVNDLRSIVASNPALCLSEDMLHLSEEGKKKCAEAVVEAVEALL